MPSEAHYDQRDRQAPSQRRRRASLTCEGVLTVAGSHAYQVQTPALARPVRPLERLGASAIPCRTGAGFGRSSRDRGSSGTERFQTRRETVGARDGHVEDAARARRRRTASTARGHPRPVGSMSLSVNPSRPSESDAHDTLLILPPSFRRRPSVSRLVASRRQHLVALRSERDVRAVQSRGGPSARDDASARAVQHGLLQARARQTALGPALRQTRVRSNCIQAGVPRRRRLRRRRRGGVRRAPAQAVGEDVQRAERDSARDHRQAARARGRGDA